jgi:hypothetical protein
VQYATVQFYADGPSAPSRSDYNRKWSAVPYIIDLLDPRGVDVWFVRILGPQVFGGGVIDYLDSKAAAFRDDRVIARPNLKASAASIE